MDNSVTNEKYRSKFKNNFDLCNFSINIARSTIEGGGTISLKEVLQSVEERSGDASDA